MFTGDASACVCQPEAVSPVNVTWASNEPPLVHRLPTCTPVFCGCLKNRSAVMLPALLERKRTPSSTEFGSASTVLAGVSRGHSEQGQAALPTLNVRVAGELCRLPLSSTARTRTVTSPVVVGTQVYDQLVRPVAARQVVPPSTDTSTPPTTPPTSLAVPVICTAFCGMPAPAAGDVMTTVGAVLSVEALALNSPCCNVIGCRFISANRYTVSCCARVECDVPGW